MAISTKELAIRQKLKDDFEHYASRCLKIRPKVGSLIPLHFNSAQKYTHRLVEQQKKETGKVRAVVLKGRQQGLSTYIEARYFHIITHSKGFKAFILTHKKDATKNLFKMVNRYYVNCDPLLQPHLGTENATELIFDKLDCSYGIGTAGAGGGVGRSDTIQLFHGSEVAYWPNAEEHAMGILQAIPNEAGTESFLESTANGQNNYFHYQWCEAVKGSSEYIAVFIPWFWQPEYRATPKEALVLSDEEKILKKAFELDDMQLAWRRLKIIEFKGDELRFKREFPCTPDEAFEVSGEDLFIDADSILLARKEIIREKFGPLIFGIDVARFGSDRSVIAKRQGRHMLEPEIYEKKDTMQLAAIIAKRIDEEKPAKVLIDVIGIGAGVFDRLVQLGYQDVVVAVNAAEKSSVQTYYNKRAEMWGTMRDWLKDAPVSIPDSDELQADLRAPRFKYSSNGATQLESKEDMRKRGIKSPDLADALALTFAYPVGNPQSKTEATKQVMQEFNKLQNIYKNIYTTNKVSL